MTRPGCSVGIMAYNEEANIREAIGTILAQEPDSAYLAELIVVASGCEDRTAAIVAELAREEPRVRLIEQRRREGKASAINLFIAAAQSPILLMVSADVLVKDGAIEALLRPFEDPTVGMVGGHPIPVNGEATFLGHAVHLQWRLHHRIASHSPKLGEMVAFRSVVPSIPLDTAVDEISIQALITQLGYRLAYEPGAIVYNRGPTTVADFLCQRRRIHAGHLRVREQQGYAASTMSPGSVLRALLGSGSFRTPRAWLWSAGTVGLEVTARGLGHYDVLRGRSQHVWAVSPTTKQHIATGANAQGPQNVLVFRMVDFHRRRLELGAHATRQLTQRLANQAKRTFGAEATVSVEPSGTIVALVPGDREQAEQAARELVDRSEIELACGLIAFPPSGPPVASSIPVGEVAPSWA